MPSSKLIPYKEVEVEKWATLKILHENFSEFIIA
jgi:hypothetical protein